MTSAKKYSQQRLDCSFTILCCLAEQFLKTPSLALAEDIDVKKDAAFWEIVQSGLVQQDPLTRKRAVYLLKKALEFIQEDGGTYTVCGDDGSLVFYWEPKRKFELVALWQDYILLIEAFDERQV